MGCQTCQRTNAPLKACLRCRCVHYCGRDCQRIDWQAHRVECEEITSVLLSGERETTLPLDFSGRQDILRRDATELVRAARQPSVGSARALSSFATAFRCLRAAALPAAEPLSSADHDEVLPFLASLPDAAATNPLNRLLMPHAVGKSVRGYPCRVRSRAYKRPSLAKTRPLPVASAAHQEPGRSTHWVDDASPTRRKLC